MQNQASLFARVDGELKKEAEKIFDTLGISMSAAINMFLMKTVEANGIPFPLTVPKKFIVSEEMTNEQINEICDKSNKDFEKGNYEDANTFFDRFSKEHNINK